MWRRSSAASGLARRNRHPSPRPRSLHLLPHPTPLPPGIPLHGVVGRGFFARVAGRGGLRRGGGGRGGGVAPGKGLLFWGAGRGVPFLAGLGEWGGAPPQIVDYSPQRNSVDVSTA